MKHVTLHACAFLIMFTSCQVVTGNKIPEKVEVTGGTTHVVRHEIVISADMTKIFTLECQDEAEKAGLLPADLIYQDFVDQCIVEKENEFIKMLEEILNNSGT